MNKKLPENLLRWTARTLGAVMVGLTIWIAVGEGTPNPLALPWVIRIGLLSFAFILIGIVLAWRWEFLGGLVSICAWGIFAVVGNINWHRAHFIILLALPGLLFLCAALVRRSRR